MGVSRDVTPRMENLMENKMNNEMDTGINMVTCGRHGKK